MNFLKKATSQVRAKVTKYEITQDEEYDNLLEDYKASKKNVQKIQKDLKGMSEHLKGFSQCFQRFTNDIAQEYPASDVMRQYIAQLHQLAEQFNETCVEEFDSAVQQKCITHSKNFGLSLDGVSKTIESRDKAKYNFDNARYKVVQMLESKKPVDHQKYKGAQRDLEVNTATYNTAAYQCKKELYNLTRSKAHNITLSALCEAMAAFSNQTQQTLGQLNNLSQDIYQEGTYEDTYSGSDETVKPVELNLDPQAGFTNSVETSSSHAPSPSSVPPPSHGISQSSSQIPPEFDTEWYYLDNAMQQQGPHSLDELKELFRSNTVTASTHVFGGSLQDWAPLSSVQGLMPLLR